MTDDIVQWLGAQLDEDKEFTQDCITGAGRWRAMGDSVLSDANEEIVTVTSMQNAEHIARHDPARVLREIDAKRQLLADLVHAAESLGPEWFGDRALHLLALPYADRPGYDAERWTP
ncbi:DUF6221 family protein [Streptomyces sp. N35]|uniref:DUF6221 family protein n=1 Tax=Streptomyces sp. N35 TaxID=2795730 RepID=UPI0018F55408|nr:DUF6221 family protein [Streptomyces sp. N35]